LEFKLPEYTRSKVHIHMGSLLHCLRRNCCDGDDDERETSNEDQTPYDPPRPALIMVRETSRRVPTRENEDVLENCCRPQSEENHGPPQHGLVAFWHRLTGGAYEQVAPTEEQPSVAVSIVPSPPSLDGPLPIGRGLFGRDRRANSITKISPCSSPKSLSKSPLRAAISFETNSDDIPTIHAEEVVLPGSLLQQQMALSASANLEAQGDECVICMDIFDPSNPRIPTLCGCGENKTFFHLPCLFQWVDQSGRTCPSCRQSLRWEEF
jgi:Ring finger domain